jgi:hypothetical protein
MHTAFMLSQPRFAAIKTISATCQGSIHILGQAISESYKMVLSVDGETDRTRFGELGTPNPHSPNTDTIHFKTSATGETEIIKTLPYNQTGHNIPHIFRPTIAQYELLAELVEKTPAKDYFKEQVLNQLRIGALYTNAHRQVEAAIARKVTLPNAFDQLKKTESANPNLDIYATCSAATPMSERPKFEVSAE